LSSYPLSRADKNNWAESELDPEFVFMDHSILTVARHYPSLFSVRLVNFNRLDPHQRWDEAHAAPTPRQNVSVKIQMDKRPSQIFWDCPEQTDGPQVLDFEYTDGTLTFQIPQINYIGLVAIYE
jgi:hypothetical protein